MLSPNKTKNFGHKIILSLLCQIRPKETWLRTMTREAGEECWCDLEELAQD